MGVQADGRVVAAGQQDAHDVHDAVAPFAMRLLRDVAPDTSFDADGAGAGGADNPIAVIPFPDGRTVIRIRLESSDVPPGRHRLVVRARDEAGYRSRRDAPFRICT